MPLLKASGRSLILWQLFHQKEGLRYNELKRELKIVTNIMLTQSLRELENDGLIILKEYHEASPHVVYSISRYGIEFVNQLYKLPPRF
ncbi:winged helix-turn-helix transcriptional regulator [Liquorilactobacillus aquaticus]|uniref:winged helix-turn-helix transcriptional regulator n=1 Tax=Liquorilactobacillus aquaticus TaxID=392566 RepID=UPI0009FADA77|nr:helix-turn-helix domain-containing protein [Liquorilactobacillus aquaticus]